MGQTLKGNGKYCGTCVHWGRRDNYTFVRQGASQSLSIRVFVTTAKCTIYNALRTPRGGGGNCRYYKRRFELI